MKKNIKKVKPKFKIPKGSFALAPFVFELDDLRDIIDECKGRKLFSLAMSLKGIYDRIVDKRNSYKWTEE